MTTEAEKSLKSNLPFYETTSYSCGSAFAYSSGFQDGYNIGKEETFDKEISIHRNDNKTGCWTKLFLNGECIATIHGSREKQLEYAKILTRRAL